MCLEHSLRGLHSECKGHFDLTDSALSPERLVFEWGNSCINHTFSPAAEASSCRTSLVCDGMLRWVVKRTTPFGPRLLRLESNKSRHVLNFCRRIGIHFITSHSHACNRSHPLPLRHQNYRRITIHSYSSMPVMNILASDRNIHKSVPLRPQSSTQSVHDPTAETRHVYAMLQGKWGGGVRLFQAETPCCLPEKQGNFVLMTLIHSRIIALGAYHRC